MSDDDEIIQEFLVESHENLDQLDRDLVDLEKNPRSRELLSSIFRTIHTIKGTSGFLALGRLEALTHVGENLLSRLRDGELTMTPTSATALLQMVDVVRALLDVIERTGTDVDESVDVEPVVEVLRVCLESPTEVAAEPAKVVAEEVAADAEIDLQTEVEAEAEVEVAEEVEPEPAAEPAELEDSIVVATETSAEVPDVAELNADTDVFEVASEEEPGSHLLQHDATESEVFLEVPAALETQEPNVTQHADTPMPDQAPRAVVAEPAAQIPLEVAPMDDADHAPAAVPAAPAAEAEAQTGDPTHRSVADSTVRVDIELLDTLVRLVGELVLTRNQILQQADSTAEVELVRASQRLNLVASELQENIMKTRMQPIGQVWAKLPRVVRDLGTQLGRQVKLHMEGHDTELDRSVLESVKDPLTHLVRNAIDHGLETPEERVQAGKPAEGTLSLRSFHESGQVVVEISDDGKGIDPAKIGAAAIKRGLITSDQLDRMDQRQILDLIFRPGFSTAAAVTNVSGRGVGMDVVRTNIERIGGTVDINSRVGQGTTVRVRIPLTLAIIPALVIGEGVERYAIPQANLVELVRLENSDLKQSVETLAGAPMLRLRGDLLPLLSMPGALGLDDNQIDNEGDALTVVVLQADDVRFGLSVAEVHDTQEIVVKPLGRQLKGIPMYAGATIMGDGRVALILDVAGTAQTAGVTVSTTHAVKESRSTNDDTKALLILDVGGDRRAALPLAEISRLEEIPRERVEASGRAEVVQYRDGILPLVRLAELIGLPTVDEDPETLCVIVHGDGDARVGIVADRVVDVVETAIVMSEVGRRPGVFGSAVVQDKVTDLVDLAAVVQTATANTTVVAA